MEVLIALCTVWKISVAWVHVDMYLHFEEELYVY
jgi:hypothetical protein